MLLDAYNLKYIILLVYCPCSPRWMEPIICRLFLWCYVTWEDGSPCWPVQETGQTKSGCTGDKWNPDVVEERLITFPLPIENICDRRHFCAEIPNLRDKHGTPTLFSSILLQWHILTATQFTIENFVFISLHYRLFIFTWREVALMCRRVAK